MLSVYLLVLKYFFFKGKKVNNIFYFNRWEIDEENFVYFSLKSYVLVL